MGGRGDAGGLVLRRALLRAGLAGAAGAAGPAPPRRVVSLNPCLDAILVQVADRDQIAALSHYARKPHSSTIAALAATMPITYGSAEEVIARAPDLVLSGRPSALATRQALERLNVPMAQFEVPETVEASLTQVRAVARLVGRPERGEDLARRIGEALRQAAPVPGERTLSALVFMPGGFASAPGTLMDDLMRRTGLENAAHCYGLTRSMPVPLERLLADPPDLLLAGQAHPGAPSRAERLMAHPALARLGGRMHRGAFPERLLFCAGPVLIQSAAALAAARRAALGART